MPTGCGKTLISAEIMRQLNVPTLFLCHRDELIRQTVDTLSRAWPAASVGVVKAERNEWADGQDVVVASVQSLHDRRLDAMPEDRFELLVVDECHHAAAPTWRRVIEHFDSRFLLGLSATPERADGEGLADLFGDRPLYTYPLRRAIEDGYLARPTQYAIMTDVDLNGVSRHAGDFAAGSLGRAVNTPDRNACIVEAHQQYASSRRSVAFCVDVQHAVDLAAAFQSAGVSAHHVSGETPIEERRELLRAFSCGEFQVLANCAVLTEGFDDPGIDCVVMARPTSSRTLYTQAVGRGLRLHRDKTDCLVLDITDNSRRHKLVTVLDLFGQPRTNSASGEDVIAVVDRDMEQQECELQIASTAPVSWRLESVCPWPELPNLRGYYPTKAWHMDRASDAQAKMLIRMGLEIDRNITKGEAHYLIERGLEFEAVHPSPATQKQRWFLERCGEWREGMTKIQASRLIGELKQEQLRGVA
jgi:superfamily II DNA or RNA helicase